MLASFASVVGEGRPTPGRRIRQLKVDITRDHRRGTRDPNPPIYRDRAVCDSLLTRTLSLLPQLCRLRLMMRQHVYSGAASTSPRPLLSSSSLRVLHLDLWYRHPSVDDIRTFGLASQRARLFAAITATIATVASLLQLTQLRLNIEYGRWRWYDPRSYESIVRSPSHWSRCVLHPLMSHRSLATLSLHGKLWHRVALSPLRSVIRAMPALVSFAADWPRDRWFALVNDEHEEDQEEDEDEDDVDMTSVATNSNDVIQYGDSMIAASHRLTFRSRLTGLFVNGVTVVPLPLFPWSSRLFDCLTNLIDLSVYDLNEIDFLYHLPHLRRFQPFMYLSPDVVIDTLIGAPSVSPLSSSHPPSPLIVSRVAVGPFISAVASHPRLVVLQLMVYGVSPVTDHHLVALLTALPRLQLLSLFNAPLVTSLSFVAASGLNAHIKHLHLGGLRLAASPDVYFDLTDMGALMRLRLHQCFGPDEPIDEFPIDEYGAHVEFIRNNWPRWRGAMKDLNCRQREGADTTVHYSTQCQSTK